MPIFLYFLYYYMFFLTVLFLTLHYVKEEWYFLWLFCMQTLMLTMYRYLIIAPPVEVNEPFVSLLLVGVLGLILYAIYKLFLED